MPLKESTEGFQAELEVVFLMSDCNAVTEQHLSVRWPEGLVDHDVGVVRVVEGLVHEQLGAGKETLIYLNNNNNNNLMKPVKALLRQI